MVEERLLYCIMTMMIYYAGSVVPTTHCRDFKMGLELLKSLQIKKSNVVQTVFLFFIK